MSRLFIFAIGGTGARVLRSMGNLLAAGVQVDCDEIVPIIIDTDTQNADTQRTEALLRTYRDIRGKTSGLDNSFFHNRILSLGDIARQGGEGGWGTGFSIQLQSTVGKSLRSYIKYQYMLDRETKSLVDLLYSQNNLDDSLTHGFLGSPNVGCVVLDELNKTKEFRYFGTIVNSGDRIFIISSIFGGTGAAGFPLLLNNFRPGVGNLANQGALQDIPIGAVTVLPYFTLTDNKNSRIDHTAFYTKSIAALSYYESNLQNVDVLYYVGDSQNTSTYENNQGGVDQKNDAAFVEVAAAMSIADFMGIQRSELNGVPVYKEYSIKKDSPHLLFNDLGKNTKEKIGQKLTLLKLSDVFRSTVEGQIGSAFAVDNGFTSDFFQSSYYKQYQSFIDDHFNTWLSELDKNQRGLSLYGECSPDDMTNIINGQKVNKKWNGRSALNEKEFINACAKVKSRQSNTESRYLDVINQAASSVYKEFLANLI